jgi:DNA-binding NarL/FixJ family response regulator
VIKVLLLDDHAVVRAGYRQWINGEDDLTVVAEASTSAQACDLVRQHEVDVAVVDLSLKDDSGLEAIRRIRARSPRTRVLVFTMHAHEGYALQALRAGAVGYLTKDCAPEAVLDAVRMVAAGRRIFSGDVAQAWLADKQPVKRSPLSLLTPREFEILRMATDGMTTPAIALALHLSDKTIYNTMSLVRQKLGVHSDFGLMRLVAEQGLLSD